MKRRRSEKSDRRARRWYLLIHQLPPRPLYLRAKIRQRLVRVGAVALKNSVYALPFRADCLEDFQWIAEEAIAGGGEAHVCEAEFADGSTSEALVARFREERAADYADLADSLRRRGPGATKPGGSGPGEDDPSTRLSRARRRFEEIAKIDFFDAPARARAERALSDLGSRIGRGRTAARGRSPGGLPAGRTWVTRRGVQVDRIASAWLIRRFLDPKARFRFVDPAEPARPGDVHFDMVGGDFTHEGDSCTFETLLSRAGSSDGALRALAEIVHDIDLKDGKFARPETRGVEQVLAGLLLSHPSDEERLQGGFDLFDGLYRSFRNKVSRKEARP